MRLHAHEALLERPARGRVATAEHRRPAAQLFQAARGGCAPLGPEQRRRRAPLTIVVAVKVPVLRVVVAAAAAAVLVVELVIASTLTAALTTATTTITTTTTGCGGASAVEALELLVACRAKGGESGDAAVVQLLGPRFSKACRKEALEVLGTPAATGATTRANRRTRNTLETHKTRL